MRQSRSSVWNVRRRARHPHEIRGWRGRGGHQQHRRHGPRHYHFHHHCHRWYNIKSMLRYEDEGWGKAVFVVFWKWGCIPGQSFLPPPLILTNYWFLLKWNGFLTSFPLLNRPRDIIFFLQMCLNVVIHVLSRPDCLYWLAGYRN